MYFLQKKLFQTVYSENNITQPDISSTSDIQAPLKEQKKVNPSENSTFLVKIKVRIFQAMKNWNSTFLEDMDAMLISLNGGVYVFISLKLILVITTHGVVHSHRFMRRNSLGLIN